MLLHTTAGRSLSQTQGRMGTRLLKHTRVCVCVFVCVLCVVCTIRGHTVQHGAERLPEGVSN